MNVHVLDHYKTARYINNVHAKPEILKSLRSGGDSWKQTLVINIGLYIDGQNLRGQT
jgi:hypothetical protein